MNEIDDEYKAKEELIDEEFFEDFEKGLPREKILEKYLASLRRIREEREKKYRQFLEEEKKRVWKKKKEKKKKEKFKRFEVEHFNFKPSFRERFLMRLDVWWFNFKRGFIRTMWRILPRFVLYRYYKVSKEILLIWKGIVEFYEDSRDAFIENSKKAAKSLLDFLKSCGVLILSISKKGISLIVGIFKRKKEDSAEEDSKDSESLPKGEGDQSEEKKEDGGV